MAIWGEANGYWSDYNFNATASVALPLVGAAVRIFAPPPTRFVIQGS
jgi:hypothetical protein